MPTLTTRSAPAARASQTGLRQVGDADPTGPACRTTAVAITPIGPAPVTTTSSPTTGHCSAVDGIAERVEEDAEVRVEVGRLHPRVGRGDDDVVGEGPVTVDPDADRVDAHVLAAGPAVATVPADDMALPDTRSPTLTCSTSTPTSTTSPKNSCPSVCGTTIADAAQSS